jgi:hypothetical protein
MLHIMANYQDQKDDLEGTSRINLVIQALARLVGLPESDEWTSLDVVDKSSETPLRVNASALVNVLKRGLAEGEFEDHGSEGAEDEAPRWVNEKSVGILLSKLRLRKSRDGTAKRTRFREISPKEVAQLVVAHHLVHLKGNMSNTSTHGHLSEDRPNPLGNLGEDGSPSDRPPTGATAAILPDGRRRQWW